MPARLREPELRALLAERRGGPALSAELALEKVRQNHGLDFGRARVRAGFSRGHLLDVVLALPGGRGDEKEWIAAETLLDALLGTARVEDWLGELTLAPAPHDGPLRVVGTESADERFFPVTELGGAFERAISGLYSGLPDAPLWALGGEQLWTLLEASAEHAPDYAAQEDLVLASTCQPELLKCFLAGSPFASLRFSRHGELFAYLKSESRESDPRLSISARRVLEDALDAALVSERAGRVIGSGLGIRYSYVNFALHAVDRGIEVVAGVAARVGLPEKSWILFCDSALAAEWAPAHSSAPPPP